MGGRVVLGLHCGRGDIGVDMSAQEHYRQLIGKDMRWGGARNRVTKLQRAFNRYQAQRQMNPHMAQDTQQMVAEHMAGVLAPKLADAKAALEAIERDLEQQAETLSR